MKSFRYKKIKNIRLLIIFIGICILFSILIIKLYYLQIVQGEFLKSQVLGTISKPINLDAPRGSIYDKFGRPLAVNESSFTVNIDPSVSISNMNEIILKVINLLEENDEQIIDEFPISKEKPYTFLFNGSPSLEKIWKRDMNFEKNSLNLPLEEINAEQAFFLLREKFEIPKDMSDEDARKILMVRTELYKKRFSKFIPLTLAYDVSEKTISKIEENPDEFIGIYIDVEGKRVYPAGNSFSHILGYIRTINPEELEYYQKNGFKEYTSNDGKGVHENFKLEFEI